MSASLKEILSKLILFLCYRIIAFIFFHQFHFSLKLPFISKLLLFLPVNFFFFLEVVTSASSSASWMIWYPVIQFLSAHISLSLSKFLQITSVLLCLFYFTINIFKTSKGCASVSITYCTADVMVVGYLTSKFFTVHCWLWLHVLLMSSRLN